MARILVVDDEDSIRELIKEVLSMDGHTFETAGDGDRKFRPGRQMHEPPTRHSQRERPDKRE